MNFNLFTTLRYALAFCVVVILGRVAWSHRNDLWVQQLLETTAPAKADIKFDNGSVRDSSGRQAQGLVEPKAKGTINTIGPVKKCVLGRDTIYTDQLCPTGSKVMDVTDGNVTVLQGDKPKIAVPPSSQQNAHQSLREALDLSRNDNIREKMMERAINK
jgi:hypothetical protein